MGTLQLMPGGKVPLAIGDVREVELEELLGVGGFASAWKVRDTDDGTPYVLKVFQNIVPGSVDVERVRREAALSIPSRYIVQAIGLQQWNPSTFLILFEYCPGVSLDKAIEEGRFSPEEKRDIYVQTLLGVADAHRHNVIHRDLKPANIIVCEDGTAKVIDFGVAKFKSDPRITATGEVIGTLQYMAPELLVGGVRTADARADIYSLGHILYELSMGQHFWNKMGWSLTDFARFLASGPSECILLDDFKCDFFTDACGVLARMVKVSPEERYESVNDVLSDLGYSPCVPLLPSGVDLNSPVLVVETGTNKGARTVLGLADGEAVILGRADICGADQSVSRQHLEIARRGGAYYVRDIGSKNGTMVKGIQLGREPVELKHGDRIRVGDVFLRFVFLRSAAGASRSP